METFPADLDATVAFYTRVLGFLLVADQRATHEYISAERDRIVAGGRPLDEDLTERPWGLTDFRVVGPSATCR